MASRVRFSLRRLLLAMSLCCVGMGDIMLFRPMLEHEFVGTPPDSFFLSFFLVFSIGAFFGGAVGALAQWAVLGAFAGGILAILLTTIFIVFTLFRNALNF
jgi:hypothetical protein